MNKRVILGEIAGLCWLIADAAWAIGDRWHIDNTPFMTTMFGLAVGCGLAFLYQHLKGEKPNAIR